MWCKRGVSVVQAEVRFCVALAVTLTAADWVCATGSVISLTSAALAATTVLTAAATAATLVSTTLVDALATVLTKALTLAVLSAGKAITGVTRGATIFKEGATLMVDMVVDVEAVVMMKLQIKLCFTTWSSNHQVASHTALEPNCPSISVLQPSYLREICGFPALHHCRCGKVNCYEIDPRCQW